MHSPAATAFYHALRKGEQLHGIFRRYGRSADNPYIPPAGYIQANLESELLRHFKCMHIEREPKRAANSRTSRHFRAALLT